MDVVERLPYGWRSAVCWASSSSAVISAPIPTYAPAAHSKSATAPFVSSCAFEGTSSPPAGILLGFWTSRALLKRSHPAVAKRPRIRIVKGLIGRLSSVAQVDGNHPLHELRYVSLLP